MSTDEQKIKLGQAVLDRRAKEDERKCLQSRANTYVKILEDVLRLHKENQHDEVLLDLLKRLPDEDKIVQTFRKLVCIQAEITALDYTLDLS